MMRILIVFIFLLKAVTASAQDSLTLEQAIEAALYNNYAIQIADNDLQIAANNVTRGNAGFLPIVDLTASQNNSVVNGEQIIGPDVREIDGRKNKSTVVGGVIDWTIFDGRRMFFNYDRLKTIRSQAEADLQLQIETIIYNITTTFYLTALEQERMNSFKSNLALSEERTSLAKDLYEVGRASKLEWLQAQVDLNADKSVILRQQDLLATRKYELLQLMAVDDTIDFVINYKIKLDEPLNLQVLLDQMETQNKQLVSFRRAMEIAATNEKIIKSNMLPSLAVFTGYNYSEIQRAVGFAFTSNTTDWSYGFTARLRIFDGFNVRREIENSQIQMENVQLQLENQKLSLITRMKSTYISLENNRQLMELERENFEVARENNEIAQERYRIGRSNALELREAQVNLINAEIRLQNAVFEAKLDEAELRFLAGDLLEEAK
ncbi:MAG: TolC family protein [Candidatus Cyclobacteriaceae bacterium M2_1C_046]